MNLLENAWVHSGSDAPIELDIKEEGNKVVFYIRDHGNGIAPERLDQLFDGCAGALDHESRKGMGIGLSICKSIVMAHQGDVYARNYEDGAEFSFSLPMDEKRIDGGKGTMTEIKFNVLIAEDEENIGNFISAILKTNGYKPIIATTGNQAIQCAESYCPDVILLDLGLPDMDGIDVISEIRKWAVTPIIVISARNRESEKVKSPGCRSR